MGTLKHLVPLSARERLVESAKSHLPRGVQKQLANAITVGGFLAMNQARSTYGTPRGLVWGLVSRAADDFDGDTSRAFEAVSDTGALLDAALNDKGGLALVLPKMWEANRDKPLKRAVIGVLAAKHAVIAGINLNSTVRGEEVKTSRAGAINMYVDSITLAGIMTSDSIENPTAQRAADIVVVIGSAVGVVTGALAIRSYIDREPQPEPYTEAL